MTQRFRIEPLSSTHDRSHFSSGVEVLDRYLREFAAQDAKRRVSNCFVALDDAGLVAAYYTLAATSLPLTELPRELVRKLPRYPLLPAGLIGRLAVDRGFQGAGLGGALIIDAVERAARADPAIYAIIVDAKDETAAAFYEHLQFRRFASRPASLSLPIATALQAIKNVDGG